MHFKQTFDKFLRNLTLLPISLSWCLCLCANAQGLFENALEEEKPAQADHQNSDENFFSLNKIDFSGFVRSDLYLGKVPGKNLTEVKNGYAEASIKIKPRFKQTARGFCEARLNHGVHGNNTTTQLSLREAYIDLFLGPIDFRFGHQIIAWGRADGINPTDNLTPTNMMTRSPNEDDRRSANLALKMTHYLNPFRTELIYMPFYSPSLFPSFELPNSIQIDPPQYPDKRFEHGTVAARIHLILPELELSASYLFGQATFPGLSLSRFNPDPIQPELAVGFRAYQHHVIGFDFATTIGDSLGFRGEGALSIPKELDRKEHIPLPELHIVLGLDRQFGDLNIIAQYVGKIVFDWDTKDDFEPSDTNPIFSQVRQKTRMIMDQTRQYSHSAFTRISYQMLQETLSLEIAGMYSFTTTEWLLRPLLSYDITDGLIASMGAEIFKGPDGTLFGTIDETMSAGFIELKAFF